MPAYIYLQAGIIIIYGLDVHLSNEQDKLYLFTLDNIINKYFLEFKKQNSLSFEVINDEDKKAGIVNECIHMNKKLYPGMKILDGKYVDFFVDEIKMYKIKRSRQI